MNTIGKIFLLIGDHKRLFFLVLITGMISSALKASVSYWVKQLIGTWETQFTWQSTILFAGLICISWILANIGRYICGSRLRRIAIKVSIKLRKQLMNLILRTENLKSLLQKTQGSGGMISRMLLDIDSIQAGIHKLTHLSKEPFLVLFSLSYLFWMNWKLTLIMFVTLPVALVVIKNFSKSIKKYSRQNRMTLEKITKSIKESLDGSQSIKLFRAEETMNQKFSDELTEFYDQSIKIIDREESAGPITESFSVLVFCSLLLFIGWQISQGQITLSEFTSYIFSVGLLTDGAKRTQNAYVGLQQSVVALERFNSLMEKSTLLKINTKLKKFPTHWKKITVKDLSVQIDNQPILKSLNFSVARDEKLALVGPSGSGKSTFLKVLCGLLPYEGSVCFDDVELKDIELSDLRKYVTLVPQDPFLFSESLAWNLKLAHADFTNDEAMSALGKAQLHEIFPDSQDLELKLDEIGRNLSGGERQRLAVAQQFLRSDAQIILFDEATSALDSENESRVQDSIFSYLKNKTSLTVAHRLTTLHEVDEILVMDQGLIKESGSKEELLKTEGLFSSLYKLQMG